MVYEDNVVSKMKTALKNLKAIAGVPDNFVAYTEMVEQTPAVRRHMRIHEGHCTYLLPEEAQFVTPELIRKTCLVGRAEEVIEQVRRLEQAGLHHLILLPSLETQNSVLERFSSQVMARL